MRRSVMTSNTVSYLVNILRKSEQTVRARRLINCIYVVLLSPAGRVDIESVCNGYPQRKATHDPLITTAALRVRRQACYQIPLSPPRAHTPTHPPKSQHRSFLSIFSQSRHKINELAYLIVPRNENEKMKRLSPDSGRISTRQSKFRNNLAA